MKREVRMVDQRRNRRFVRALSATVVMVLVATTVTAPQEPPKAPATIKVIMATMTVPSSEVIFEAVSEPPKADLLWAAVLNSATTLAESGELLMTGGRTRDNTAWMAMSRGLVTRARAVQTAAQTRSTVKTHPFPVDCAHGTHPCSRERPVG